MMELVTAGSNNTSDATLSHHVSPAWGGTESTFRSNAARRDLINALSDPSLLRGVPSSLILQRFGELLKCPTLGWQLNMSAVEAEALYNKSHQVSGLNWFISHSWRASRWQKYIAICWVLRGQAAATYAFGASLSWIILEALGVPTPRVEAWVSVYSLRFRFVFGSVSIIFAFVYLVALFNTGLLFGMLPDSAMFLDKCCIHQTDPVRKEKGIKGLGGFLRNSERMLVLWSPDYFERLWCTYEVASFIGVKGGQHIDFVNLLCPTATIIMIGGGAFIPALVLWRPNMAEKLSALNSVWLLCFSCMVSRLFRACSSLRLQLTSFRLKDAKCFCCMVNHIIPSTGAAIPCDREFVIGNVRKWFLEVSTAHESDGIEAFERIVQNDLAGAVKKNYLSPICSVCALPVQVLLILYGVECAILNHDPYLRFCAFFRYVMWGPTLCVVGSVMYFFYKIIHDSKQGLASRWSRASDLAFGVLVSTVFAVCLGCLDYCLDVLYLNCNRKFSVATVMWIASSALCFRTVSLADWRSGSLQSCGSE